MPQTAEIKCINKSDRTNLYERITHIGGFESKAWKLTLDDAIGKIERDEWEFYVSVRGHRVWVIVGESVHGHKYLRTTPDGDTADNLLSLPECP